MPCRPSLNTVCESATNLNFTSNIQTGNEQNLSNLHIQQLLSRPGQAGAGRASTLPTPGYWGCVSLDWAVQLLPLSCTGDQLVGAGFYNTSVIRLRKWRQLTRLQLRRKPQGPVCKLHCSHKQSHWIRPLRSDSGFGLVSSAPISESVVITANENHFHQ